jgi:hypothetical protein
MALSLAPNPFRGGLISRVAVPQCGDGTALAVAADTLYKNPRLLSILNPGYTFAIQFWKVIALCAFWGGLLLRFIWTWWAFIPAIVIWFVVEKNNQKSAAQFAIQAMGEHEGAAAYFDKLQLLWTIAPSR